jgi:hypothetical protein
MKERLRIYYCFVLGAAGGLHGWFGAALLFREGEMAGTPGRYAGYGALLGAAIGLAISVYDAIGAGSWKRSLRGVMTSLIYGGCAGALAIGIAQWMYQRLLASGADPTQFSILRFLVGVACWVLLGATIGFGETLYKGVQRWKGLAGGALGGLIGGALHETARAINAGQAGIAEQAALAVSLTILGGAIGAAVALIAVVLRKAWIEVLDGKLAGRVYDLTKFVSVASQGRQMGLIGSDEWKCHVYLPADPAVAACHAQIGMAAGIPFLGVCSGATKPGGVKVNGHAIVSHQLTDGDRLTIGSTSLRYHERRESRLKSTHIGRGGRPI